MARERSTNQDPQPERSQRALAALSPFFGEQPRPCPPSVSSTTLAFLYETAQRGIWDTLSDRAVQGLLDYFTPEVASIADVGKKLPGGALSYQATRNLLRTALTALHHELGRHAPQELARFPREEIRLRPLTRLNMDSAFLARRAATSSAAMKRRWAANPEAMTQLLHSPQAHERRRVSLRRTWAARQEGVPAATREARRRVGEIMRTRVQDGVAQGLDDATLARQTSRSLKTIRRYRRELGVTSTREGRPHRKPRLQPTLDVIRAHQHDPAVAVFVTTVTHPVDQALLAQVIFADEHTLSALGKRHQVTRGRVHQRLLTLTNQLMTCILSARTDATSR